VSRFRLKIHQFLFASFNPKGYKLVKCGDLNKLMSDDSIIYLCRKGGHRDQQTFIKAFLADENLFTISCVTPYLDSAGRATSSTRTIIINTEELQEAFMPLLTADLPVNAPKSLEEVEVELV